MPVKPQGPGKLRNQGEAVLRLAYVADEDAGKYFCVAENEVGKTRADVSISITGEQLSIVSSTFLKRLFALEKNKLFNNVIET